MSSLLRRRPRPSLLKCSKQKSGSSDDWAATRDATNASFQPADALVEDVNEKLVLNEEMDNNKTVPAPTAEPVAAAKPASTRHASKPAA